MSYKCPFERGIKVVSVKATHIYYGTRSKIKIDWRENFSHLVVWS